MQNNTLEILYHDDYFVAINKPHGLLVHRSGIASRETVFALQLVRDQIGMRVFPVHRLDRKTSGVLLFAKSGEAASKLQQQFENHTTVKKYEAIVRGFFPEEITVNHALINDKGKQQDAITHFICTKQSEIMVAMGRFCTSRYSFIEAYPKTGRMHQIRKHLNHLRHPIIGDRPHGCNKQNKLFKERWNMTTMMLHACELTFIHPYTQKTLHLTAKRFSEFDRMLTTLNLC